MQLVFNVCNLELRSSNLHTSLRWRTADLIQACLLFLKHVNLPEIELKLKFVPETVRHKQVFIVTEETTGMMLFQWENSLDDESATSRAKNRKHS